MQITLVGKRNDSLNRARGVGIYASHLYEALVKNFSSDEYHVKYEAPYRVTSDLVHYPFFDPFFLTLPSRPKLKTVVTVHDLIPILFSEHFLVGVRGKLKWKMQLARLKRVNAVITDSTCSKEDIIRLTGIDESKIFVVPLAPTQTRVTVTISEKVRAQYQLPRKYLLYVGDINWNKNVIGLINAFNKLEKKGLGLVLVGKALAGPDIPEKRAIMQAIQDSPKKDQIKLLGFVPSHHLPMIYKLATLYVQPSWYEGFGLPILEAMTQGCPVVSSSEGSLREVGGDAVVYFDPHKGVAMKNTIHQTLSDLKLRKSMQLAGYKWFKNFSWDKVGRDTHLIYEKVISQQLN